MNKKDLSEVLLKILGLYLLITNSLGFICQLNLLIQTLFHDSNPILARTSFLTYLLQHLLIASVGLSLLLATEFYVNRILRIK